MRTFVLVLVSLLIGFVGIAKGDDPAVRPKSIEIVLDLKNRIAFVPEGTIVPTGLRVSGKWGAEALATRVEVESARGDRTWPVHRRVERGVSIPFVFQYAPDELFAPYRKINTPPVEGSKAARKIKPTVQCSDPSSTTYYVSNPDPGCGGSAFTFVTQFCVDPNFSAVDSTDTIYDDLYLASSAAYSNIYISSDDSYFQCYDGQSHSAGDLHCSASDTRHFVGGTRPSTIVSIGAYSEFW